MRARSGVVSKRRHKKILTATKGYRLSNSKTYRRAHEAYLHAGMYSYKDRRKRLGQFRRLWITRITAALQSEGVKYSRFINSLKKKKVTLNRKILSQLAVLQPNVFSSIVKKIMK